MEEIVISSSDTNPEAVALFRIAVRIYETWCHEHDLAAVRATTLRINPDKSSYVLYADGGTLTGGTVDALRAALDRRQTGPHSRGGD